jgi:outer membrane receptor for ferrienterochelin and colicin
MYQRWDHYQYADQSLIDGTSTQWTGEALPEGITDGVESESADNFGYNAKAGVGFGLGANGKAYVNAGYYSRAPYFDNIYLNFTNRINPNTSNETIIGLEAGYVYEVDNFSARLDVYRTSWADRVTSSSYVSNDELFYEVSEGVSQLHQGVELTFMAKPQPDVPYTLKGFLSIGDWIYEGEAITRTQDEDQNVLDTETQDIDGGKVGDAAQFTAGLGLDVDLAERLSFDSDIRFYDELYANVGAVKENLKLPNYHVVDMGLSYKMFVNEGTLDIRVNVNNVFDNVYISELRSAIAAGDGTGVLYNGIDTANQGYFGLGRTWNVGLRYNF